MSSEPILRALVVSPTPTWPLNYGNRKRIFSVCNQLKQRRFEVHFVHFACEMDWHNYVPIESRQRMNQQWDIVDHVLQSNPAVHQWPQFGEDHLIDEWWDEALQNHLKKTFEAREYDLLIVNYTWLSKALELAPPNTLKLLDTHDVFSGRRNLLESNDIQKEFFHTTEEQELVALNRADVVWAIKEDERVFFEGLGAEAKIETLLHIDQSRKSLMPECNKVINFGFISANNNINRVNLRRFIEQAEPVFEKYLPPLQFYVAGSICSMFDDIDSPFVKRKGYLESVDEFYDTLHCAVIPMEFSTGLKIKVAEAFSHLKPIVSHQHAMEGFPAQHKYHECKSFQDMAIAMCEIAFETSELVSMQDASINAYDIVKKQITQTFDSLVDTIFSRKQVVAILPLEYGDEQSLIHWLVKSRLDWIGWSYSQVIKVKLGQSEKFGIFNNDVRMMSEEALNNFIFQSKPELIINLCWELPSDIKIGSINCISLRSLPADIASNVTVPRYYPDINDLNYLPMLGHINPPLLDQASMQLKDEIWVISDDLCSAKKVVIDAIAASSGIIYLDLNTIEELDKHIKKNGLPFCIIIGRLIKDLNLVEQLMVDISLKYNLKVIDLNQPMIFDFNRYKYNTRNFYDERFFDIWERFKSLNLTTNIF
ncbi:MAG: glycosyltransferase [Pseudomonadota bacterium]|nr:glycosyltransferase [Pseudomonadota bacterium]